MRRIGLGGNSSGRSGGGGWRERAAAKKASKISSSSNSSSSTGMVLRVSRTGFGFVGASTTARQRFHFKFQDVISGDPTTLNVGDSVSYDTRMNDETMEKEAYNVRISNQSKSSNSSSHRPIMLQQQRNFSAKRINIKNSSTNQVTKDQTDQFGNKRAVQSGALLDIIDGGEENVTVAKSCDDYDINPTLGNGFSVAYQRSRGKVISVEEEKRRMEEVKRKQAAAVEEEKTKAKEQEKERPQPSWMRRGNGKGRSLADMM
jgi:hypothetical protein